MAQRVYIPAEDLERLRDVVDQHSEGRDARTAELLAAELDRATVLEADQVPADVVVIGARVAFEDGRTGAVRHVVLVYPAEADASAGRISVLAPVGAALLGLRVGDTIEWPLPAGKTALLRILSVEPPLRPAAQVA